MVAIVGIAGKPGMTVKIILDSVSGRKRLGGGRRKAESRKQKTESRRRKAESGKWKVESGKPGNSHSQRS
jgi:hypothetical protein